MSGGAHYCLAFMTGTEVCYPGAVKCSETTTTTTMTTTIDLIYGRSQSCRDCSLGTSGPCRIAGGSTCIDYIPDTETCFSGSYACDNTVELTFDVDFVSVLPTEAHQDLFAAALRFEVSSVLGVDIADIPFIYLSPGSIIAVVSLNPVVSQSVVVLRALVDQCNFCVEFDGSLLCSQSMSGTPCESFIDVCEPDPCTNGAICTPTHESPGGFACICPQNASSACYAGYAASDAAQGDGDDSTDAAVGFSTNSMYLIVGLIATLMVGVGFLIYARVTSPYNHTHSNRLMTNLVSDPDLSVSTSASNFDDINSVRIASFLNTRNTR